MPIVGVPIWGGGSSVADPVLPNNVAAISTSTGEWKVGDGTTAFSALPVINGTEESGTYLVAADVAGFATKVAAPAAANSTGVAGTFAFASGFAYFCVATNTWQRVAIATWP